MKVQFITFDVTGDLFLKNAAIQHMEEFLTIGYKVVYEGSIRTYYIARLVKAEDTYGPPTA